MGPPPNEVSNETLMPGVAGGMAAGGLDAAIVKVFAFDTSVVVLSKLATFTTALPAVAISEVPISTSNWDDERKVVPRTLPFHCTVDVESKFEPLTTNIKSAPPAFTVLGPSAVICGATPADSLTT